MTRLPRHWKDLRHWSLTVGYLLIVAAIAAIWGWSILAPLNSIAIEQQRRDLIAIAQAGAIVLSEKPADAQRIIEHLVANTDLHITLIGSTGEVLVDSEDTSAVGENHADLPEVASALTGRIGFDRRANEPSGLQRTHVAVPVVFAGQQAALSISKSKEEISQIVALAKRLGLLFLGVTVVIALVIVKQLARSDQEPLDRLSAAAKSMASGDFSSIVTPEEGRLSLLSSALTEIRTQMRRQLEDLQVERHNLLTALEGLTDAIFLLHGDEIYFANSAAGRLFRVPALGWRGQHVERTTLPASVAAAMLASVEGNIRITECGPDASGTSLRISVIPLNPTEQFERTLVIIYDVTERTRIDQVRRDFVANASHELKTPAAAIQLLAESALDAANDGDTKQAMAFVTQIAEESRRLGRLVSDLLELSRLEGAPMSDSITDIREVVANALLGHRTVAMQRNLSLELDDSAVRGMDLYAQADPTDVAVAFDNLLDNAIKYTEKGGVTVSLRADSNTVTVSFTDTGIGIPAEDVPRIFERFYRVDRARSRDAGSTGLGLSLVRHIVERANGSVAVTSEPGAGSTFTVTLPRAH